MASAACAQPAQDLVPAEFMTPELAAYLATDEGKKFISSAKASALEQQKQNMADPALAKYFELLKQRDESGAFVAVEEQALSGHAQAQTELAYLYQTGTGTKKDIDKAVQWYSSASQQGNLMATSGLASIYYFPQFGRQDVARALPLFRKCALKLRPSCVSAITHLYATQENPDIPKAFAWASVGTDFSLIGAKEHVAQLRLSMTDDDYAAATDEKRSILSEIIGP